MSSKIHNLIIRKARMPKNIKTRKSGLEGLDDLTTNPKNSDITGNHIISPAEMPAYEWLSERVFRIEGKNRYYYYSAIRGRNVECNSAYDLQNRLIGQFLGTQANGVTLTKDIIENYIDRFCMLTKAEMAMPLVGPVAEWQKSVYINSFQDKAIIPSTTSFTPTEEALISEYLGLVAEGLFSISEYKMDVTRFMEIVLEYKYSESDPELAKKEQLLNYFFNWVAVIYQRPGISLPTIPCLFGRVQGTGKGTLSNILTRILGNSLPNVVIPKEGISKFNSVTEGKLLCVYNEVEDAPGFYNTIIKGENSEETMAIEGKGKDRKHVLNILNLILCSNKIDPFKIDTDDRRLVIIQTIHGSKEHIDDFKQRLVEFRTRLSTKINSVIGDQLVKILAQVDPNIAMEKASLYYAIRTKEKELMEGKKEATIQRFFNDTTVEFIKLDPTKTITKQKKTSLTQLEKLYKIWSEKDPIYSLANVSGNLKKNSSTFKQDIKALAFEETYICVNSNNEYFFTDDFYNWFTENYTGDSN